MVDSTDHTKWKRKWRWHNRGCVWDKTASEWAGVKSGLTEKKMSESGAQKKIRDLRIDECENTRSHQKLERDPPDLSLHARKALL